MLQLRQQADSQNNPLVFLGRGNIRLEELETVVVAMAQTTRTVR